jgi:hypothetical protein
MVIGLYMTHLRLALPPPQFKRCRRCRVCCDPCPQFVGLLVNQSASALKIILSNAAGIF